MNRAQYFDYIEERLNTLATRIHSRGKLNILGLHVHSEDFYLHFFNKLYGWNLTNLNNKLQNVEAIDLVDNSSKIIVQVSATSTKEKIESTLQKDMLKTYNKYNFKFISISKDASALRKRTYANPHGVTFVPLNDIYDTISILNYIKSLDIDNQKIIYQFIKNELGNEVDIVKLDSNLAMVINILSKEDWDIQDSLDSIDSFEIERKISFNNLSTVKYIIDGTTVHKFTDNIINIDAVFNELGVELPLNDLSNAASVFTPSLTELQVPFVQAENMLSLIYKAAPDIISPAILEPASVEVPIPYHFLDAVTAYIAWKLYTPMSTGETNTGNIYRANYLAAVKLIDDTGALIKEVHTNQRFHTKGWI